MEIENLLIAEFDLATLFDITTDLVCIVGKDGYFKKINPAVSQKLGFTEEQLLSKPVASFIHPDDREMARHEKEKLLNGKVMLNFENRYLTKKGEVIWLEWMSIYFSAKEVFLAIAKDVTIRKRSETEVEEKYARFRNLAHYFKISIEEDRKYLAAEIHEELAQLTYALKLDIDWLLMNLPHLPAEGRKKIEHASGISHLLITSMRKIAFELYPNMIDELGLSGSLQWLCKEFTAINGIPCKYTDHYRERRLPVECKVDIFRICQEALSNIMYHAEATEVEVTLWSNNQLVHLTVSDDGKGFDVSLYHQSPGLISMRERANSINGELNIESEKGKGSCVWFTITLT